ncbi:DUF2079 domain-containing protein [Actinoallomurus iriomotensis]|uniref:DUF2079 domain-containing protein n=1 Tax=Actinoallomurus iriomotensis TaxID=478107 RepID=A0A9W6S1J8_9ACTN|nr:DUF2079 domain-containing protein [Actinoallomurus iriomotensis]GLY84087.1 hypothetical protein Airi02_020160 [Actinoallomurus iriomotensis]
MLAEATEPRTGTPRRQAVAVGALTVVVAAVYSVYALVRFWAFRTTTYDLVIFDQAVRSYSRLHLPVAIVKGVHNGFGAQFNVLGDHFSPILALLAPLYWIHDGPQTLLVAQSVLLALTIVPLWAFTRRRLGSGPAYCVSAVYALAWPVAETLAFDFHEMAFAPVLSMLVLERHEAGRRWQSAAAAGALLLVKEDMGLLVAGFGLYLLTRPGERRRAAFLVVAGVFWTWLASRVLIPAFGGSADYYWAYDALGRDLPHAAAGALTHPWTVGRLLVTPHVKVTTMLWLVAPLLLLPLLSPITLAVLPLLAERMLSSRFGHWWEPRFHYNVALAALLVAAGVDGAARLGRLLPRLRAEHVWPVAALAATLAVVPHFAFAKFAERGFYRRDARARAVAAILPAIPDGALVEAPNGVGPQLSGRTRVLLWDVRPRWAPWVVADVAALDFPFPSLQAQRDRVSLLRREGYAVVRQQDGYVLLNRPGSVPDLRPAR